MALLPHDLTDLYLAPVILALDAVLEEWSAFDQDELAFRVSYYGAAPDWTRDKRADVLLTAIGNSVDRRGWSLAWHPRGLLVTHSGHRFVLGVPANFHTFIERDAASTPR
jgi:hypothetical protein